MNYIIAETTNIKACHILRMSVFVEEQGVPAAEEIDDLDDESIHFLASDETGDFVGTARVYFRGNIGKIGRVCVVKPHRGTGLGQRLIADCVAYLRHQTGIEKARLGAQIHAIGFYEKLGFCVVGEEYLDGGILHRDMERPL